MGDGKMKRSQLSTKKAVSNLHKFKSVSDSKLNDLKTKWMKPRTFNKMQLGVNAYNVWHADKVGKSDNCSSSVIADLNVLGSFDKSILCESFIPEVTKV